MQILAAVVDEPGAEFRVQPVDLAEPAADEVLVEIAASGICRTDLHARDGEFAMPFPAVFGHEGAGIVIGVGSAVRTIEAGDHVLMVAPSCGVCATCLGGEPAYCLRLPGLKMNGLRADGSHTLRRGRDLLGGSFFQQSSFATHALATERNAVKVDEAIPLDVLAALSCGVSTGAGVALNVLSARPGSSLAVVGAGAVGLAGLMAARDMECEPRIAVDILPTRLEVAQDLGATHVIDARVTDIGAGLQAITSGAGVDGIMDTTAAPDMIARALAGLSARGVLCLVGTPRSGDELRVDMKSVLYGRTIRGSIQGDSRPAEFVPYLVDLYRQGRFPFDRLITHYPFEQINRAVEDLESGRVIKPVLRMAET